jgi:hypothetical protein
MNVSLQELIVLDQKGLILPPTCEPQRHVESARATLEWAESVRRDLERDGKTKVMGAEFRADQLLSAEVMADCLATAETAYGIRPDWVPAFYSSDYLPWYVGGAAFYDMSEGFLQVCFLLRESFRDRSRWLIYDRNEIACHETCHVARAGFDQQKFEEPLAYALSGSMLRRHLGAMFTGRWEAPAFLGSSLLLIAGSLIDMLGYPSWVRLLSAVPLAATGSGLATRSVLTSRTMRQAIRFLETACPDVAPAIVFRCTDEEILSLARAPQDGLSPSGWLDMRPTTARWEVIKERFTRRTEHQPP